MAHYLIQVSYTPEAWVALMKNPQDRSKSVGAALAKLGGKMEGFWAAFGDYDVVAIGQFPDNVSAAAFSMAVSAGGALRAFKTTPLMTAEEAIEAMKKAGKAGYQPPKD